jgi:hypothetical protein
MNDSTALVPTPRFATFGSLPQWAQEAIVRFCSDDGEAWVVMSIPALGGESFLSIMNQEDGEQRARAYLNDVISRFFPGESLSQ